MPVYFDLKVHSTPGGANADIQWHKTNPLLAVASYNQTKGGFVNLYHDEGEHIPEAVLQRSLPPTVLAWHPTKKVVAVGWESGEILLWSEHDKELSEAIRLHKSAITVLDWSSNGSRLVSGDASGFVIVWKADPRGRLQSTPLCQHNLEESLTALIHKPAPPADPSMDLTALARAAVSGDESALDMFSWRKPGKNKLTSSLLGPPEGLEFFVAGDKGGVYFINENGKSAQAFQADDPIRKLIYYEEKQILVTVTDTLMLYQHSVNQDGETKETMKAKLSGKTEEPVIILAGNGVLAMATGETVLRMWDLERDENFVLSLEGHSGYDPTEVINCVAYCAEKGILAGGTSNGNIAMWKYSTDTDATGNITEADATWKLQAPSILDGVITQLRWGTTKNLLAANAVENVYVLSEQVMSSHFQDQTSVVQTGPCQLTFDFFGSKTYQDLKTDIQVKGVFTSKENVAAWNGKKLVVYEFSTDRSLIKASGTFNTESTLVCLYEQNVYTVEPGKVQVRTFQGTVKQLLNFTEVEGDPICMDICTHFLVVGTDKGTVKVFDLSRREAKQHGNPKSLPDVIQGFGSLVSAKCNCNGSKVSFICNQADGVPDPKLYVWDIEMDTIQYFNFETGRGEQDELFAQSTQDGEEASDVDRGKAQAAHDIALHYPVTQFWDPQETKLVVCETKSLQQPQAETDNKEKEDGYRKRFDAKQAALNVARTMAVSLFVTPENGILMQDSFVISSAFSALVGVEVPYYFFSKKSEDAVEESTFTPRPQKAASAGHLKMLAGRTMRDFIGLEHSDKNARDAMLNFSYYLTIGNMDEAFKAIKLIKSESVWENMAKMCVKTRRLDVAQVCLGNMGHARGAKALREAMKEPEIDARVAALALQLGLLDDAERLLKNCKRYDLLNQLYQASGQWNKALETAEMYDRIHLRTTYYNYAKYLEAKGDIKAAIPNFEKSDTHRFEVPRMLFEETSELEAYIMRTKDKALRKWWAQYMESTGEMETALQFYEAAQDFLSLVRVYCYCGNLDKAAEICNETGDRAACYHLARQFENQDNIRESIHFFTRAQAYGNAIRLCKENGLEDQLMNLALLSNPHDMMEAARYYEDKPGCQDKAVMLYHKSGNFSKALELAFTSRQFGALQLIAGDLDEKTDPELLQRCADFFMENGQNDRAVDLLAIGKRYWEALKLCAQYNVPMTEELGEKLTPPKAMAENEQEERIKVLEGIAEICLQQRQYHLATKKYTQSGNKLKAMKALLKSGDTEKIVFFAGVSRQKEIYVMAANYLQSLDWRKDPEIMKNIIGFYTKGRTLDLLAGFYDACAQVEIDEYQNYDKALGALNEAYKCMAKAKMKNQSLQEEKLAAFKQRINLIKKFVQARRVYDEDPDEAVKQCQVLLEEPELDSAVRMGDVYGFTIEHYARKEKWKAAYSTMEEMRTKIPTVNMAYYVNMRTIEAVHQALDIPLGRGIGAERTNGVRSASPEEDGEEFVEEEVAEFTED